ncbi:hypothetical protein RN629_14525 [Sphingomonadaceae bacterium jetA1]|jgi:hypothetical protein|uniref:hypothetical protein n=1 Tax=Facivitalis istanbulensis TaxID=3075838 RepID=UPI0034737965
MSKFIFGALVAVGVAVSGVAAAAEFENNAKVEIKDFPGGGKPIYTLIKQGEDANKDGIYLLKTQSNNFLTVQKPDVGAPVGWTQTGDPKAKPSKWILHKNSTGWSIIAAGNGANTVTKVGGKLVLQRNQGTPTQVFQLIRQ